MAAHVRTRWPYKVCEACGAEMVFLKNEATGKWVPCEADPDGTLPDPADLYDSKRHTSHYLNCSDPDRFTRGQKPAARKARGGGRR